MTSEYIFSGSLPENASTYVTRQADTDLYDALNVGAFCYVLNSRQTGKSSLRVRTMRRLREEGIACAAIDLSFGGTQYVTMEQWYVDMLDTLVESFGLDVDLEDWWEERELLSPLRRFRRFIEEILLVEIEGKIVIFIDEIDSILSLNFPTDDFFAFIRACYQERVNNPEFHRLTFCLLGVATPTNLIQDKKRTPFNIGRAIALKGFQPHEVQPLVQGLQGKVEHPEQILDAVLAWTGGQPFLTQKVCHLLASGDPPQPPLIRGESSLASPFSRGTGGGSKTEQEWVAELVQQHVIENWEAQDEPEHLRTIRDRILSDEQRAGRLLGLYQEILQAPHSPLAKGGQGGSNSEGIPADDSQEQIDLRLTGLVIQRGARLEAYNSVYKQVFDLAWVKQMLASLRPYSEAIDAWLTSECQDKSRLLRGQALQEAVVWSVDKTLSSQDYQFLAASQELDKQEIQAAFEAERKAKELAERANLIFQEAQQKAEIALEKERQANQRFVETQRRTRELLQASQRYSKPQRRTTQKKPVRQKTRFSINRKIQSLATLSVSIVLLTSAIGHRFYVQPPLREETVTSEKITIPQDAKFEDKQASDRAINGLGLLGSIGLVVSSIGIFEIVRRCSNIRLRPLDYALLCLLSISTPLLVIFNIKYINLPAVGLLISRFYGSTLATTHILLLTGLTAFSAIGNPNLSWNYLIPSTVGGLLAAARGRQQQSPEQLAGLGGIVGVVQGITNLVMNLAVERTPKAIWTVVMPEAIFWELSGIAWCWLALGLSPYLKQMFDIVTPNEIIDWSTPIPPAIERLIFEAPDIFQQTMFVTALAEVAAQVTDSNVNLVRAGAIYHNIGKLEDLSEVLAKGSSDARYKFADTPWQKAEQFKMQISRGLMIAQENRLPGLIKAFIPEHKGTILMNDLYQQAQKQSNELISEADFRYEGNIPQSPETGIVMISHACAKVLQSMSHATPDEAFLAVNKEIELLWSDGQLRNSGLNKAKTKQIANKFIIEWEKTIASRVQPS